MQHAPRDSLYYNASVKKNPQYFVEHRKNDLFLRRKSHMIVKKESMPVDKEASQ